MVNILAIAAQREHIQRLDVSADRDQEDGEPFSRDYAERPRALGATLRGDADQGRRRDAPGIVTPNDEFADFGTWDKGNLNLSEPKTDDMLQHE